MDFSLIQAESKHFALRDILALKARWPYYFIMTIDPIIRFAWIFYAIFTHNRQHSTIVSFLVAFMEVTRRGMWALFRVENEHCANVSQYKASRDVPLPYRIEPLMDRADPSPTSEQPPQQSQPQHPPQHQPRPSRESLRAQRPEDTEQGTITGSTTAMTSSMGTLRQRADTLRHRTDTLSGRRFSKILSEAHRQDFEKRRKTAAQQAAEDGGGDDQDDDEDEGDETDLEVREASELKGREER